MLQLLAGFSTSLGPSWKKTGIFVSDKSFFLEMFGLLSIHQSLDFLVVDLNNQNYLQGSGLGLE